jgi:hypothetical protein
MHVAFASGDSNKERWRAGEPQLSGYGDISVDSSRRVSTSDTGVKESDVQPSGSRVSHKMCVIKFRSIRKQLVVHWPKAALARCALGINGGLLGVLMYSERQIAEHNAYTTSVNVLTTNKWHGVACELATKRTLKVRELQEDHPRVVRA